VRVIAPDKILADFARILSLLKGAESSFLYNQLGVDLVPVELPWGEVKASKY